MNEVADIQSEGVSEASSLFDTLARLVPDELQKEYYRVVAHTQTLGPDDEMLRILEAMGILALVTRHTGLFRPFFADMQHSLNGLQDNIMQALTDAVGFIAVMHPRGDVFVQGRTEPLITGASVWVEQEIAIAAYIDRQRKKRLMTAVYQHQSVGREGMRELLHLNPIPYTTQDEILRHLQERLSTWRVNESIDDDGELFLKAAPVYHPSGGRTVAMSVHFRNDGDRADQYSCAMQIPASLMKNAGMQYLSVPSDDPRYMKLVFTEAHRNGQPILNDTTMDFMSTEGSITDLRTEERAAIRPRFPSRKSSRQEPPRGPEFRGN